MFREPTADSTLIVQQGHLAAYGVTEFFGVESRETNRTAQHWIDALRLEPHPEGGWFREVYRADESIPRSGLPDRFTGDRAFSTSIYFLLQHAEFSALHRIRQDELWHFYDGSSLTVDAIDPQGKHSTVMLGRDVKAGESLMAVIKAGSLFGASLRDRDSFALVGCTVAPGFCFDDFEMPRRGELIAKYPQHSDLIDRLTRG
jgi:predicted cupin superfamily sugar epimerase